MHGMQITDSNFSIVDTMIRDIVILNVIEFITSVFDQEISMLNTINYGITIISDVLGVQLQRPLNGL